ncbi:hypothetical protein RB195_008535 [Necator americanus]|uniref:Transthyretin-like family protein n=1 Tax=Necator americanus TaxID=51031 RepID=A0ABR1CP45_NECAM
MTASFVTTIVSIVICCVVPGEGLRNQTVISGVVACGGAVSDANLYITSKMSYPDEKTHKSITDEFGDFYKTVELDIGYVTFYMGYLWVEHKCGDYCLHCYELTISVGMFNKGDPKMVVDLGIIQLQTTEDDNLSVKMRKCLRDLKNLPPVLPDDDQF